MICWFLFFRLVTDDILHCASVDSDVIGNEKPETKSSDHLLPKSTYVKLLGLEKSKEEAQRIVNEAKALLDGFGEKAVPLKGIADYILNRKS
jgi:geranylgeranyl diphosphate synthase type II